MVTTYGDFPGVRIDVAGGGITAISVGSQEKLFLFGEASYQNDDGFGSVSDGDEDPLIADASATPEEPETINARREADALFGSGSELADGMREALANSANIDYLYGVAPRRYNVVDETQSTQAGTLSNFPIWEENVADESNINGIEVVDDDAPNTQLEVRYSYDENLSAPPDNATESETVVVNPLTGEYIADQTPVGDDFLFSYKYLDWTTAIEAQAVSTAINEEETAIFSPISDSDDVTDVAAGRADTLRTDEFKLVNVVSGAEPNSNEEVLDSNGDYLRNDARFDTIGTGYKYNGSEADYVFRLAPTRLENSSRTIIGGVAGLFAGNPINDPIYNDVVTGYDTLEQGLNKTQADALRNEDVIPIRQAGSIRVRDNLSTSQETDWERDFWRRRITDRVILIGEQVGDRIIGRINDDDTRDTAERLIEGEMRSLVSDRLLKPNTSQDNSWYVDVYESSTDSDEVKIDIGFTPYGIVKQIDETVTVNTR